MTVPESGPYILMVTYLHPERFIQRVFVTVGYQRGMLEILPCKYQFACRQFAMDDNKRPRAFELKATPEINEVKIESSASATIAVVSIRTTVLLRGGYSTKFYTGRLCPEVQPPCPFVYHFDRKSSSFVYLYLFLRNGQQR